LDALACLGQDCNVDVRTFGSPLDKEITDLILRTPSTYPAAWVRAAESAHSASNQETALALEARDQNWVPQVPRI
jgi:hypothetical protein